jgi:serine O-acetyltransferase
VPVTLLERLKEDVRTAFRKDPAARSVLEVLCCYPGLHAIWLHRVAHWLWLKRLNLLARLTSHFNRWLTGIEIHPGATIGRRFFVDHGMGVVIGETAEVGDDVLLYQGVVLGGTSLERAKRHPSLGNDVVIGTGAVVLGPLTVGDGARIGAGSVVVRPVQAGVTVVGVPARPVGKPDRDRAAVDLQHANLPDPVVRAISASLERSSRLEERVRELEAAIALLTHKRVEQEPAQDLSEEELEALIREALGEVIDPGIGMSLADCGFVHDVMVRGKRVEVQLQLDDPECAFKEYFEREVYRRVLNLDGITQVDITFMAGAVPVIGDTEAEGSAR